MRNRGARAALIAMVVIGVAAGIVYKDALAYNGRFAESFQALAPTPAFQLFLGPPRSAIFTNLSGQEVVGLKLTFSAPMPSATGYGIGADATVASNKDLTLIFDGAIGPFGGVYAQWNEEDAQVLVAGWLTEDGSTIPIDLHEPFARMSGTATYWSGIVGLGVVINVSIVLDGGLSTTYDGSEIVRYRWEWEDGLIQEGPTAERMLSVPYDFHAFLHAPESLTSVTLTVWTPNGSSSSVTRQFKYIVVAAV
jgi:hypothetical protein